MRGDEPKLSRGEQRLQNIQQQRLARKTVAKSAAHQGVMARPMDQSLSKILEKKRAAVRAGGTSVKRLGDRAEEAPVGEVATSALAAEEREALLEANSEKTATQRATSAARLRTAEGEMGLKKTAPLPEPPDMAI